MPTSGGPLVPEPSRIDEARRLAAFLALVGLGGSSLAWFFRPYRFLLAYGAGLTFWFGVATGCAALAALGRGGRRRWLIQAGVIGAAGGRTLPVLAVVGLPAACSFRELTRAADTAVVALVGLAGACLAAPTLALATLWWLSRATPEVLPPPEARPLARLTLGLWLAWSAALSAAYGLGTLTLARGWRPSWPVDLTAIATLTTLWCAYFLWNLDRRPPAPLLPGATTEAGRRRAV